MIRSATFDMIDAGTGAPVQDATVWLLTDAGSNLDDLFEPGSEVATYRDADDLVRKISYFLEHDEEREAIAQAGQARTLREHTYAHRMEELVDVLEDALGKTRR